MRIYRIRFGARSWSVNARAPAAAAAAFFDRHYPHQAPRVTLEPLPGQTVFGRTIYRVLHFRTRENANDDVYLTVIDETEAMARTRKDQTR